MTRAALVIIAGAVNLLSPGLASSQAKRYALTSAEGIVMHNVVAEPGTLNGKQGLRVSVDPEVIRRPEYAAGQAEPELLASIAGLTFTNGVIEAEVAGAPAPGAFTGARGFVGIAFRVQNDKTYDAFYLRPTNGRAEDQERRNHATQYISHPDWTWSRLRREMTSKYESYVDLEPNTWTKIRIEVQGDKARLFVHDQQQPALIVNDVKSGANKSGTVALWIGPGTVAHFRNLVVTAK